jgi:oligoribonuclease NrnB/cAMP/cGMP phosphodiesterase (DHH superfamily)
MNKELVILTHNDLDALGCMINLHSFAPNIQKKFFYTNYNNLQTVKENVIDYMSKISQTKLLIMDVSFSDNADILLELSSKYEVTLLDHHQYPGGFFDQINAKVVHDVSKSATRIAYEYFSNERLQNKRLIALTTLIDVYDIWQVNNVHFDAAQNLNRYFWTWDLETLYYELINNDLRLPSNYEQTVQRINDNAQKYLANAESKKLIHRTEIMTFAMIEDFHNELVLQEFKDANKLLCCTITSYGIIRVRLNELFDMDVETRKKIKYEIQRGREAGHVNAFTYKIDVVNINTILSEIKLIHGIIESVKSSKG